MSFISYYYKKRTLTFFTKIALVIFLLLPSCSKDDEYDNLRNPVDVSKLKGKALLVAKKWENYKTDISGIERNSSSTYSFKSDGTYTVQSSSGVENGTWSVNNDTVVRTLTLDDEDWNVTNFTPLYLAIEWDSHVMYMKKHFK